VGSTEPTVFAAPPQWWALRAHPTAALRPLRTPLLIPGCVDADSSPMSRTRCGTSMGSSAACPSRPRLGGRGIGIWFPVNARLVGCVLTHPIFGKSFYHNGLTPCATLRSPATGRPHRFGGGVARAARRGASPVFLRGRATAERAAASATALPREETCLSGISPAACSSFGGGQ
jgi:hypothetical protein